MRIWTFAIMHFEVFEVIYLFYLALVVYATEYSLYLYLISSVKSINCVMGLNAMISLNTPYGNHYTLQPFASFELRVAEQAASSFNKSVPDWTFQFHAFFTTSKKITTCITLASQVSMLTVTIPRLFFYITSIFNYRFSHNMSECKAHYQRFLFTLFSCE